MQKLYLLLVLIAIVQAAYSKYQYPKPNWQLKTEDTHITIAVTNNRPVICELKNRKNGWNWIKGVSEMPFPENVLVGGTSYQLNWKYQDAVVEKSNGTKITLRFKNTQPDLDLESVWEANPGVGPVENSVSVKNNSGQNMTFKAADVISANIDITADSTITLWRFNKGRYPVGYHIGHQREWKGI
jgi:hypothetical protein